MNKNTIEYLAYLLDKAYKEEGREKAIVFLGAGASVSAGIPLTDIIVRHIKLKFFNNPIIRDCIRDKKDDYYSLMGALTADERRDLFHFYVTRKRVKLNIANIYLAQLLKIGYVDYIVTVNFDDLILKACTLYNFLPPVYDISNIKTITTTDIRKNSVIYLHGQYFGQWLLNNPDELAKVEDEVLRLFNAIKTRRTWIVVGYSGNDGIFEKIKSLGSFSNELFWIKNKFFSTEDKNVIDFIETPNLNAHKIEGFYADSFFLRLHAELSKLNKDLEAPEIISKPFTFVKSVLQSINEIKDDDELNDNVKKMVISCNDRIDKAINEYESVGTEENLKQRIIDATIKGNFNEEVALAFEDEITEKKYSGITELSWYYNNWADKISDLAKQQEDKVLFKESIEKFERASKWDPNDAGVFYNWGNSLLGLAKLQNSVDTFEESVEKYKQASKLDSKGIDIFNNWGTALSHLAKLQNNEEIFKESFEKYEQAAKLDPKDVDVLNNWGTALLDLAKDKKDDALFNESLKKYGQALKLDPKNVNVLNNLGIVLSDLAKNSNNEALFKESFDKYEQALELDPKNANVLNNWGTALSDLAKLKNDEELFKESFDKYKRALELDLNNVSVLNNWGTGLIELGKLKNNEKYFIEALEISQKGYNISGESYNMSCAFALLSDKESALIYLKETLDKKLITLEYINTDNDWNNYRDDQDFINLLNQYR